MKSVSSAGLRRFCGQSKAWSVAIRRDGDAGLITIEFTCGAKHVGRWASYDILKQALRRWKNIRGAKLFVNYLAKGNVFPATRRRCGADYD